MPSKITSEKVGSGMTAHTRRRHHFDMTQPLTAAEAEDFDKCLTSIKPYDPIGRARGLAERTLKAIEDGLSDPEDFEPHHGMGWYSREIIKHCNWLEKAKERGDHDQREELGYEIGRLLTEATMTRVWGEPAALGAEELDRRERRRAEQDRLDEQRRSIVEAILAEPGHKGKVRGALRKAAQRHPETTEGTFRRSYYKKSV